MGLLENSLLFSKNNIDEFKSCFNEVFGEIVEESRRCVSPAMKSEIIWMETILQKHILEESSHFRGLLTIGAFKHFAKHEPTKEELQKALYLGWCEEIIEAYWLMLDDINENNVARNSSETWSKNENIGMAATNDCLLLAMLFYRTLRQFFRDTPVYNQISGNARHFDWKKLCGNCLATETGKKDLRKTLTLDRYTQIVKLKKCSTNTKSVTAAIILAGHGNNKELLEKVEKIVNEIFQYFQIHNDFYAVFGIDLDAGSRSEIMKRGLSETADSLKDCSWLLVKAAESQQITDEELRFLANYLKTQSDPESGNETLAEAEKTKMLLINAGIEKSFQEYRESAYEAIMKNIASDFSDWENNNLILSPVKFFETLLNEIKGY